MASNLDTSLEKKMQALPLTLPEQAILLLWEGIRQHIKDSLNDHQAVEKVITHVINEFDRVKDDQANKLLDMDTFLRDTANQLFEQNVHVTASALSLHQDTYTREACQRWLDAAEHSYE